MVTYHFLGSCYLELENQRDIRGLFCAVKDEVGILFDLHIAILHIVRLGLYTLFVADYLVQFKFDKKLIHIQE